MTEKEKKYTDRERDTELSARPIYRSPDVYNFVRRRTWRQPSYFFQTHGERGIFSRIRVIL